MSEEKEDPKKKPLRNWAILSGIAFQMGGTIFLFAWIGQKLDARYPSNKEWFTIAGVLLGVLISVYVVIRQLNQLNK